MMLKTNAVLALVAFAALGVTGTAHAQSGRAVELTAQDRADIQDLAARYARALADCKAEEYADLFAPETGYFFSNIRGELAGREHLIALVKSERQCNPTPNAQPAGGGRAGGRGDAPNTG